MEKGFSVHTRDIVRKAKGPATGRLYSYLWNLRKKSTRDVWIISGTIGGEPAEVFFAGSKVSKSYIARLWFGGDYKEKYFGKVWGRMLPLLFKMRKKSSVGIFEIKKKDMPKYSGGFFVPGWVGGDVDLMDEQRFKNHERKNDMRRIRKNGLSYEATSDRAHVEDFYKNIYMNYINQMYAELAYFSPTVLKEEKWDWDLLRIRKDGEFIGAGLLQSCKGVANIWAIAAKDEKLMRLGVSGAAYHFGEEYLRGKGFKSMHYGGSRPFFKDGVFSYKRARGMRLKDFFEPVFFIRFSRISKSVRNFLLKNPFLYLENNLLMGAVFVEAEKLCRELVIILKEQYFIKGMARLNVFVLGALPGVSLEDLLPESFAGEITISRFPY